MIRATLVTDGSSDRVLVPLLEWVMGEATEIPAQIDWADLRGARLPSPTLRDRVVLALDLYPCNLLFVHRDAEGQPPDWRYQEVTSAVPGSQKHVAIVPVRMQEAWLLHDEDSIRRAASRPSGREPLDLPKLSRLEKVADPKEILHKALVAASGMIRKAPPQVRPQSGRPSSSHAHHGLVSTTRSPGVSTTREGHSSGAPVTCDTGTG